jgi:phosphatidylglycerophosphate synthase
MIILSIIPWLLIGFRAACAPALIYIAIQHGPAQAALFVTLLILALLSDVFDGIIARYGSGQTEALRRWDSQVDTAFWLAAAAGIWLMHPGSFSATWQVFALIISMQALCYVVSLLKFGKENCTHAWLSKFWAVTLLIAFSRLALTGKPDGWLNLAVVSGFIAHLDVIAITLLLPQWRHDVPSCYHAYLIRRNKPFRTFKILNG